MAVSCMILGVSGTGKSASMRNCDKDKFALVNVAKKPLPFKGKFTEVYQGDNYQDAVNFMKKCKAKSIVIDDAQYLMGNEFMRRVTERGYDKYSEMAQNMWKLLNFINQDLPADKIVYLLGHIERDQEGNEKFKTMGKLIDQCINVEGTCTIVLKTHVADGQYSFLTQNSGHDTVKSPIGMFPSFAIDNDLNYVDEKIRNYYEIGEFLSDEDIQEIDEAAKKEDIPIKDEKKGRRARQKPAEARPNESDAEAGKNTQVPEEKPARTRKRSSETPEEREAARAKVEQENSDAVVTAGLDEADETGTADFKDVPTPEVKPLPRRKSRRSAGPEEAPAETETPQSQETGPEKQPEETAAPRRRRRRV